MQHAFEMLMKAALNQRGVTVFDKKTGKSIGLDKAVNLAQSDPKIKLSDDEAGLIRAIDTMRDEEQHWYTTVDEGILYMHIRAGVTLFDDLLERVFAERLGNHIPRRVLPIGAEPPREFQLLVDDEFDRIRDLLKPGRRMGAHARARIRTLLAMEAHSDPDTLVSDNDVNRVMQGITEGKTREQVFAKLSGVTADLTGDGVGLEVRFVKIGGLPVTFVEHDVDASAVRVVDLQKKFYLSANELAKKLGVTAPRGIALRRHVGAGDNENMSHTFKMGKMRYVQYSDNAFVAMRDALKNLDMDALWTAHRPTHRALSPCTQNGCAAPLASVA
jgi:hypothetical protein